MDENFTNVMIFIEFIGAENQERIGWGGGAEPKNWRGGGGAMKLSGGGAQSVNHLVRNCERPTLLLACGRLIILQVIYSLPVD